MQSSTTLPTGSVHPWQVSYHQPRGQCQRCRPGQRPACTTHPIVWLRRFSWRQLQHALQVINRLTHNHFFFFFYCFHTHCGIHPSLGEGKIWVNQFIEFHELLSPNPWAPSTAETEQHTSQELAADKAGRQQNTKRKPLTLATVDHCLEPLHCSPDS